MDFQLQFFTMVASQGLGFALAAQLASAPPPSGVLLDPDRTWIPWTVLTAIVGLSVYSTIKVIRFVDGTNRDIHAIKKALGLEEGDDE